MKLYTFYQSGSAYRVGIALNLKGVDYEAVFVRGGQGSEELRSPAYRAVNPQGVVPTLVDGGRVLMQSLPIIEYREEIYPNPPLLPVLPANRQRGFIATRATAGVAQALESVRSVYAGVVARGRPTHWALLPRRYADRSRCLPDSASVCGPALWL